jgi:hypothetical protein
VQNPVRLEIAHCVVPADELTVTVAAQSLTDAQTSGNLIDIEHAEAQHQAALGKASGLTARVNGAEFPIFGYEIASAEDGRVLATLVVEAASLSIGDPSQGTAAPVVRPAAPEKPTKGTWGRPGPDPREGIPGWTPESSLGEQVAQNAQPQHDHTVAQWSCGCDPMLVGLQQAAAQTRNIDLRVMGA